MKFKLVFLYATFFFIVGSVSGQTWIWKACKPGNFNVGYKTVQIKSYGAPYTIFPISARVLPVHIWYPALKSYGSKMKFIDYVKADRNVSWGKQTAQEILYNNVKQYAGSAIATKITELFAGITSACIQNAHVAPGKYPVVLLGNGLTAPGFYYTLMAEYLASYGYVVVGYPSIPETSTSKFNFNERGIFSQIGDMEMVFNEIYKLSFIDAGKLSLVSWSVGSASQILFQMKDGVAKAVVSLDAASQYEYGKNLIKNSFYYDSTAFKAPLLNLVAAAPTQTNVQRSKFFFDTLATDKQQFFFLKLIHANCLSFSQYITLLEKPDEGVQFSYERMCDVVRLYLDARVLNLIGAKNKLKSISMEIHG